MRVTVTLTRDENKKYYDHQDQVDIDLEDYVCGVVASEIGNSALEACKALAVAARTNAINHKYKVSDTNPQAFRASRIDLDQYPNPYQSTIDTEGEYLSYNDKVVSTCSYSKSNGGRTVSSEERWGGYRPYLISQPDPWDLALSNGIRYGHGVGMSQYGIRYAASISQSYVDMLSFYYPGTKIVKLEEVDFMGNPVKYDAFMSNVSKIIKSKPDYELGHDGSDGKCDCIGLIIGAIRRSSGTWKGTHGTNYAMRSEVSDVRRDITSVSQLKLGDAVFKGRAPGTAKYALPDKYRKGGSADNGDYIDYYHVGVVTQLNPLRIDHMTSPTTKTDTKLGNWKYAARLKKVEYASSSDVEPDINQGGISTMTPISKATVVRCNGYLNLRASTDPKSTDIGDIPLGSVIYIYDKPSTGMWQTQYNGTVGWVNSQYLDEMPLDGADTVDSTGIFIPMSTELADAVIKAFASAKVIRD